jgi:uncharacterized oxidoreductase
MRLMGNTILVTGGGTGIGRGLAESFHRLGNQVIIAGRRRGQLESVAAANPGMQCLSLDQSDAADIERFAAEATQRHPELNVLINNAGIQYSEDLTAGRVAEAEAMITTNLLGPIRLTAALSPCLLAQPRSAVLNVTSQLAFLPKALAPTYCATKAALHSYTQSLRFQLRNTAVQVIEIIPPGVQTGIRGERDYEPTAMPVDEYIAETMALLTEEPEAIEIVVDAAKPLRFAERDGVYDDIYPAFNQARTAGLEAGTAISTSTRLA